jgi:hypothetical protein
VSLFGDMKMYARFAWGLRDFLGHTITADEARAIIKKRMTEREANFLRLVKLGVFGYPRSPYLPLMKLAGCEMGDVESMVRAKGLEPTLHALRDAGVYIGFEEFKGRAPIVRGGRTIAASAHNLDNPYLTRSYTAETGGTTGAGTRVETDLDHIAAQAPYLMLTQQAHGVLNAPAVLWRGVLPDGSGINNLLRAARYGRYYDKWFSQLALNDSSVSFKYRAACQSTVAIGRLLGKPLPWPEYVPLENAIVVARWAADAVKTHGACLVACVVSRALRACIAARDAGISLHGVTFMIAGEPPTPAKVKGIESSGARQFPTYGTAESGRIGMGCSHPAECNDLHLLKDAFGIIQKPRQVPGTDIEVDAFNVTSLLPSSPKIMLNVEIDDYGVIERRSCNCPLEELGFTEHIRGVRSFRKLTGEGVTLVGSEMVRILEEVLPASFGGSPLDYQLVEEEDERGFTRLRLLIDPRVKIEDEQAVIDTFYQALGKSSVAADAARSTWHQAQILRLERSRPIWTARGKLMPLHLARRTSKV